MIKHYSPLEERLNEIGIKATFVSSDLTSYDIEQLKKYALSDELVIKFTRDRKRFIHEADLGEWLEKGRKVYKLIGQKDELLAIAWIGKERVSERYQKDNLADAQFTLAVRVYGQARGKGLAGSFIEKVLESFLNQVENNGETLLVWLETSVENLPVHKIFSKLEFGKLSDENSEHETDRVIFAQEY